MISIQKVAYGPKRLVIPVLVGYFQKQKKERKKGGEKTTEETSEKNEELEGNSQRTMREGD